MSKSILIIGMTGTGKTTEAKKLIQKFSSLKPFIYDVNNEYGQPLQPIEDFLNLAAQKRRSFILFEEATIFFGTRGRSEKMLEILVKKRHNQNVICLNFHALRYVPNDILALVDYIYLKRTNDNPDYVQKKFKDYPEIFEAYKRAQNLPDRFSTVKVKNVV